MKSLPDTEEPEAQGPGSAVSYKVRQLDEKGVYQEVASGTTDERKAGDVWVVTPDFKLEWSYGSTKGGWLYVGALPKGAEYYSEQVRSSGEKGGKLDPAKWTVVKKVAPPADPASGQAYSDPKATYRTFLEAVRRCDLEAAQACIIYEEKDAAAMKVAVGIWIAHRRFGKAVEARFGQDEKSRGLLEGWLRPDVTDKALEVTVNRLPDAVIDIRGDKAQADMKWDELDGVDESFAFPQGDFRKVDGRWKFDPGEGQEDFFAKGGWGNVFRALMEMLDETAGKVTKGDFKTVEELKAYLDAGEKALTEQYENELRESVWDRMGEKKE